MQYYKILLIDDDKEDHEIFLDSLNCVSNEFQFYSFTNASKALKSLRVKEIEADVIFLDLNMPIMSGQEFLLGLKKEENIQDIPVIIFSTSSDPQTIQITKDLGAANFITKPDRFDKLVDILKSILL
ncbi:response regulator [Flavobacterium sp. HTF]|uniref:response regulator n=1 Tax=Flavobacterium sp. HTF TaxID=2170732 RepID=UPI000D5CDD8D|nr:response regulator [Flavobacterium sp. HTF]PWB27452.1 response regulator [Flavobacterium sp. HTF]